MFLIISVSYSVPREWIGGGKWIKQYIGCDIDRHIFQVIQPPGLQLQRTTHQKREKSRLHFQFHQKAWVKAIATTTSKKNQISIVLFGDFWGGYINGNGLCKDYDGIASLELTKLFARLCCWAVHEATDWRIMSDNHAAKSLWCSFPLHTPIIRQDIRTKHKMGE